MQTWAMENTNSYTDGHHTPTIAEVARTEFAGYMDVTVLDIDFDMMAAFVYEPASKAPDKQDSYDKFIDILARNVRVIDRNDIGLICDFSGYFRKFNDALKASSIRDANPFYFLELCDDDTYYGFVDMLNDLIPGNASFKAYDELLSIFNQEDTQETVQNEANTPPNNQTIQQESLEMLMQDIVCEMFVVAEITVVDNEELHKIQRKFKVKKLKNGRLYSTKLWQWVVDHKNRVSDQIKIIHENNESIYSL